MLTEMAAMHAFVIVLGNPVYSFSVILATLLLSLGLGSVLSKRIMSIPGWGTRRITLVAFCLLLGLYFVVRFGTHDLLGFPFLIRVLIVVVCLAPVGFCLGMFFPHGIRTLGVLDKDLVPWAWAINGFSSIVVGCVSVFLVTLTGYSVMFLVAACLYLAVPWADLRRSA